VTDRRHFYALQRSVVRYEEVVVPRDGHRLQLPRLD
jgi:hypothetical protein